MAMPIALAADHAGLELKNHMKEYLNKRNMATMDFGTDSQQSVDYPDYARQACRAVLEGQCSLALLFCGTGVGMSIAANKMHGIRACCCSDAFSAEMTRRHNNANVLCLGGRVVGAGLAETLVDAFLGAEFEEGGNHRRRIDKVAAMEAEN